MLEQKTRLKPGDRYRESKAKADATRLTEFLHKQSRLKGTVELIAAQPTDDGRVMPVYRIAVGPEVLFETKGIKPRTVRSQLHAMLEGQIFDEDLVLQYVEQKRKELQSKGYYRAKVDYSMTPKTPEALVVTVTVDQGAKYRVEKIAIDREPLGQGEGPPRAHGHAQEGASDPAARPSRGRGADRRRLLDPRLLPDARLDQREGGQAAGDRRLEAGPPRGDDPDPRGPARGRRGRPGRGRRARRRRRRRKDPPRQARAPSTTPTRCARTSSICRPGTTTTAGARPRSRTKSGSPPTGPQGGSRVPGRGGDCARSSARRSCAATPARRPRA